jgi:CheY-like chemotaxis protein
MKKIVVVEDDEVMRELLSLQLTNAGYEVHLARDAAVAAHAVTQQRPDLVLADIDMPFMNGLQLVEAMKGDPETALIPVIFITGNASREAEAMRTGAAGFLTKPLREEHLLRSVAALLKNRKSKR